MIRNTMRAAMTAACVMNDDAASAFDGVWKGQRHGRTTLRLCQQNHTVFGKIQLRGFLARSSLADTN
jgi:hypothetical protein